MTHVNHSYRKSPVSRTMKRCQLSKMIGITLPLLFLPLLYLITRSGAMLLCPQEADHGDGTGWNEISIRTMYVFAQPQMFVTSFSQDFRPYSIIDKHRRTAFIHEYLMVGYNRSENNTDEVFEQLRLVVYNDISVSSSDYAEPPDVVHQNLENELYWRYFNSTGVYPWLTISNATTDKAIQFQAMLHSQNADEKGIAYVATLAERSYIHEPQIPFDAIFEIPGNSKVLKRSKTMIQYQSFSLWRWKLSNKTADWAEVSASEVDESVNNGLMGDFKKIENPCTKDMFLVSTTRLAGTKKSLYLGSPLIQSHLDEHWFYDMSTDEHPWAPDTPIGMVLVNDYFFVLTNSSLWISKSLNFTLDEDHLSMNPNFTERPSLEYRESNPCEEYNETITCFDPESEQRLFYNPVCYLYQVPNYDDYLIFLVKNMHGEEACFTVLYSLMPYDEWRILFTNVYYYVRHMKVDGVQVTKRYSIRDIVGLFFNHHSRQFDITISVSEESSNHDTGNNNATNLSIRFSLRETISKGHTYGELLDKDHNHHKKELDGLIGKGFVEFAFPENFKVESVMVNGDTQDVFFLGNQLWIAESGGAYVYRSVAGIGHEETRCSSDSDSETSKYGKISECSFNHPDRTFVCLNDKRSLLLAGKIGSIYSPLVSQFDHAVEIYEAQEVNAWSTSYVCKVIEKYSVVVAGYSGKILVWYMHDPQESAADSGAIITNPEDDPICKPETKIERLCSNFKKFKEKQCTAEPVGEPRFKMLTIDPTKLEFLLKSTDGPLVPFFLDSAAAILFEGTVPEMPDQEEDIYRYTAYFTEVDTGRKLYCRNYNLLKTDANDPSVKYDCELYIQHFKPVEKYMHGFRSALHVGILQTIPMLPIPADFVVLVAQNSNKALIKINDHINEPAWTFEEKHIGQTLYLPGEFSILLTGFPKSDSKSIMAGYTTLHKSLEYRRVIHAFFGFLMDMSTKTFREAQLKIQDITQENERERLAEIDKRLEGKREAEVKMRDMIKANWGTSVASDPIRGITPAELFAGDVPPYVKREDIESELLTVKDDERNDFFPADAPKKAPAPVEEIPEDQLEFGKVDYNERLIWYTEESECDYAITMTDNPILKSHGGRISLDLNDAITLEVQLTALTRLGKVMMYRSLLAVTNSNPQVLKVDMKEKVSSGGTPQVIQLMLRPTGFMKGVSVVSIRGVKQSLRCKQTTSITFILPVHREVGRRLHINYPIPACGPTGEYGMYPRPWYSDHTGCVRREELLTKEEIVRHNHGRRHVAYISLPPNYRPPSFDGADVPNSKNIYNGDPSKPPYKNWYKISRETFAYELCKDKKDKSECLCTDNDRLVDDEFYTECKDKVYYTERTGDGVLDMSADYDRLMPDEDQDPVLFTPKMDWSVTIEEINGRSEWYMKSHSSPYLHMINSNANLSEGMRHYDMKNFRVGLLGTGLYHFKVTLGRFESFDETAGYFILYVTDDEFNHLHLFMILLGTIIFCMTMVFLGFVAARKRLSSMLPIQPMSQRKKLKLL